MLAMISYEKGFCRIFCKKERTIKFLAEFPICVYRVSLASIPSFQADSANGHNSFAVSVVSVWGFYSPGRKAHTCLCFSYSQCKLNGCANRQLFCAITHLAQFPLLSCFFMAGVSLNLHRKSGQLPVISLDSINSLGWCVDLEDKIRGASLLRDAGD